METFLSIPNGIPYADTFRRVFSRLDGEAFQRSFASWVHGICEVLPIQVITIDGKKLPGSKDGGNGKGAIDMLSA